MSTSTPRATCIRNADWVVAWDSGAQAHVYLRDVDVAFSNGTITHVGRRYEGPCDDSVDGRSTLVMPGLINLHAHPEYCVIGKGIVEELGRLKLYMSGLYGAKFRFLTDEEGFRPSLLLGVAELLRSGVTTFVDLLDTPYDSWIESLAETGIRAYAAPMYRCARTHAPNDHSVQWIWNEPAGEKAFEQALELVGEAQRHPSGRLRGMLAPARVDVCTPAIFAATAEYAARLGVPRQTHAAQSVVEFHEMIRRHGVTPIHWLEEQGFLGQQAIVGHGIFIDENSWLNWYSGDDLGRLHESGTSVAHCPAVFARNGQVLEDLGKYHRAGVNVGFGTDAHPHNMLDEMRWAAILARVAARRFDAVDAAEVFSMATIGGARALGRDDLWRIAIVACADLVVVDLDRPEMQPLYDPLRSLLYTALERPVRDVFVDGRQVLAGGVPVNIDFNYCVAAVGAAQERALAASPANDWAKRSVGEMAPLSLPVRQATP